MAPPMKLALASSLVSLVAAAGQSPPALSSQLDWLPKDITSVSFSPARRAPLLRWITGGPLTKPSCLNEQLDSLDLHAMISRAPRDRPTNLFHGKLRRDALERCAVDLMSALGKSVEVHRLGAVTELSSGGQKSYVGWTDQWAIWDDDRSRVEALLAASKTGLDPGLSKMLRRVDPCSALCGASMVDFTSKLLGVRSLGYFFSLDLDSFASTRARAPLTLLFPSAADARKAQLSLEKIAHGEQFSPALRQLLRALTPTIQDKEVQMDVSAVFNASPEVMQEVTRALQDLAAAPARK
jgi:hypothetical protein